MRNPEPHPIWLLAEGEGKRRVLTFAAVRRWRAQRDRIAPASATAGSRGQADSGASNTSTRTIPVGDDEPNHPDGPSLVLFWRIQRAV
jgi:hypothetical protein